MPEGSARLIGFVDRTVRLAHNVGIRPNIIVLYLVQIEMNLLAKHALSDK